MNHVFEGRHLELDVRVPLAFEPIEQLAPPLLEVWSLQRSSETCVCCRLAALEGECLQLGHVPGKPSRTPGRLGPRRAKWGRHMGVPPMFSAPSAGRVASAVRLLARFQRDCNG